MPPGCWHHCAFRRSTISGALFTFRGDRDISEVMVRAYNDWHVEDWCGKHPDRFIPMGILPSGIQSLPPQR